ncbi:membrane protein [Adhaeribacter aerolatus]|uniref:Membrane protein n=1 Tax=Adhaeribacter aerolatus TaxID=670289 RepID=A0A512B486_9BACT|nr:POTRA domain-containing protein [Adhaeribacter aerolatus]GEO06786.1 membrane protein [Adhaeribacter aerolatus]
MYKIKLRGVEENDPNRIMALYQQRPNRKVLGATPYLSIYYFGKKFFNPKKIEQRLVEKRAEFDRRIQRAGTDSNKIENLLRKREKKITRLTSHLEEGNAIMQIGEPPVIYDSLKAQATLQQIHNYLNSKGYFKHQASFTTDSQNKKLTLNYNIQENVPYTYSQVNYNIKDTAVAAIIDSTRAESLVKVNQHYDEEVLVNERDRIELLLKNLGYYQFKKQFIVADVDTSFEQNQVRLQITINNDNDTIPHQVFRLGRVNFKADANLERFGLERDTILFNRIYYLAYNHRISPRIIDKKITIRPGQRYSLRRTSITNRLLTNLDMFRFLSINYQVDTLNSTLLTANINANPSRRFQETTEAGVSYSAYLPGPFGNLRLTVRNIFGGAELFEIGFRGGLEGQFALNGRSGNTQRPGSVYTTELGANTAIIFPQFLVPFNANRYFIRYSPRTRVNLNYTYIDRQEFTRTNQQTTFDYIWQMSNRLQHVFTPFDLSINSTHNIDPGFKQRLINARPEQNREVATTYEKSFASSFISSMNYTRVFNTNNYNHTLDAIFTRLFVEESGLLGSMVFRGRDSIPLGNDYLKIFKYYRVNTDVRRYFKLAPTTFLVSRLNIGLARAFDKNDYLPYDRYYYAGGGTSVRAFRPRRLGPGSYFPVSRDSLGRFEYETDGTYRRDIQSEQQGELLLEANMEYRFNLFSFVNGAVFLDAGNIWMLTNDPARPGSQFEFKDFWKEFAVGTGFGFRFDFTFLIARIDLSAKVYDPSLPLGKRFVLDKTVLFNSDNYYNLAFNLGIGYPF